MDVYGLIKKKHWYLFHHSSNNFYITLLINLSIYHHKSSSQLSITSIQFPLSLKPLEMGWNGTSFTVARSDRPFTARFLISATRDASEGGVQQLRWQDCRPLRPGGDAWPWSFRRSKARQACFHRWEGRSEGHRQEQTRWGFESTPFSRGKHI